MTTVLETLTPEEIGERLRLARENAGVRQVEAAAAIEVARTTIVAIEQGLRRVRMAELQKLASLFGQSVNALLRRESVHVELAPQFRKMNSNVGTAEEEAAQLLCSLAKAEVELENLLGVRRTQSLPPERPILAGDVRAQAEQDAQELRQRVGLGMAPVSDIVTLLELELGVRVYIRRVDSRISGLFAFEETIGAHILLNANHPRVRRTQTAAHECGHLVSNRRRPDILHRESSESSRDEQYANAFGSAFLMPARTVMQQFKQITAGSNRLTRHHVIVMAHFFGVSREALVRRLEELKLTKRGTWEWFQDNGGITDDHERQVLGDLQVPDAQRADALLPTTLRLNSLAVEAYRRSIMSEGQLSRLLHVEREELRRILQQAELPGAQGVGISDV